MGEYSNEKYVDHIHGLIPAPGWRALSCVVKGEKLEFAEVPAIGWGIIHCVPRDPNAPYENIRDYVQLFIFVEDFGVLAVDEACELQNRAYEEIGPEQQITNELKRDLEECVRRKIAWADSKDARSRTGFAK